MEKLNPIVLPAELESHLQQAVTAQMLKYAAGTVMFCPGCQNCLDWRSTVSIDFIGKASGKLHSTATLCAACADKALPGLGERLSQACAKAGEGLEVRTSDGRDWYEDENGIEIYDPAPKPALGKPVEFNAARPEGKSEWVKGYELGPGCLPDWAPWVVYELKGQVWFVVELRTGFAVARGDTWSEAVILARRRLNKAGKEKVQSLIAAQPKLN